jgi:uncharacterized protein YhbP (UPF0306 family)
MERHTGERDPGAVARKIIDATRYMVIATTNDDGSPWISPVWFAHDGYHDFLWLSRPGRRHSLNIAARGAVAITIFDSTQRIGNGFGVTMSAEAAALDGEDLRAATEIVSRRSVEHGGGMFGADDFAPGGTLRLYRAVATEQFVILGNDERVPIAL